MAVYSHLPDRRETDSITVARVANERGLVLERRAVALREAGDVTLALRGGRSRPTS